MSKVPDQEVIVDMLRRVTKEVFSTMLSLEVLADEAYTELQAQSGAEGVVSLSGLPENAPAHAACDAVLKEPAVSHQAF